MNSDKLIIPVYINEKIVLDMLAIIEDGFSMVSQVNYTESHESNSTQKMEGEISTSATLLSRLLKIKLSGELNHSGGKEKNESVLTEKVHTNVSLLFKLRKYLFERDLIKSNFDLAELKEGDFVEIQGELQKNTLIDYMDIFVDIFRMADVFSVEPQVGNKAQARKQKESENSIVKQIESFGNELKHSGTIDFILTDKDGTAVLSAQEQYLENDNISEIIGGRFEVLGKVISVYKNNDEEINLLRKTTLSILPEKMLTEMFTGFQNEELKQFNLPELKTKIKGPAIIIIPIAIYA